MRSLRWATPGDAPAVREIYGPIVERTAISFEVDVPGEQELADRIRATLPFAPWLVCEDRAGLLGYAYASRHRERAAYRWSVDVSVYVRERGRRSGVGRALYTSLLALLRVQGFHAAHAGITLPNEGSVGLHEALGFRRIGVYPRVGFKLGAWHDVGWWQLELRERVAPPAPVRPPELLRGDRAWAEALAAGLPLLGG
jgi:L-amino acid N-acyltransferase YncA